MFGNKLETIEKLAAAKKGKRLISYTKSKDPDVKLAAIRGLGIAGGEDAVNTLVPLLKDDDPKVRAEVARSFGMIAQGVHFETHTKAHLQDRLKIEEDEMVIEAIREALSHMVGKE